MPLSSQHKETIPKCLLTVALFVIVIIQDLVVVLGAANGDAAGGVMVFVVQQAVWACPAEGPV